MKEADLLRQAPSLKMENDKYRLKLLVIECKYNNSQLKKQIFVYKKALDMAFFVTIEQFKFIKLLFSDNLFICCSNKDCLLRRSACALPTGRTDDPR